MLIHPTPRLKNLRARADLREVRRLPLQDRVIPAIALIGAGAVLPGTMLHFLGRDAASIDGEVHFVGVGVSAAAAAAAAVVLSLVGARRGDGRTVLVGTVFTVMAGLLAIHGLATPGIWIGDNGVIALTGAGTLPVGGAVLALTALPSLRRPAGVRRLLVGEAVAFAERHRPAD